MKAAEIMWLRSIDKHKLRYSTMLSDGDSKAHKKVDGNPYAVSKEECVNHVHKRLTYHLSKVAGIAKRDNVSTGGGKSGQLTALVIKKLAKYYGKDVSIQILFKNI